jgi:hypothetical protein
MGRCGHCSRCERCLGDHDHLRDGCNETVPFQEQVGVSGRITDDLAQECPPLTDLLEQGEIPLRIGPIQSGGKHRDRHPFSFERAPMGLGVDATSPARYHHASTSSEIASEVAGEVTAEIIAATGADDRDHGSVPTRECPAHHEALRGVRQVRQARWPCGVLGQKHGLIRQTFDAHQGAYRPPTSAVARATQKTPAEKLQRETTQ